MYTSVFKKYNELLEEEVDRIVLHTCEILDAEAINSLDIFKNLGELYTIEDMCEIAKTVLSTWEQKLLCTYENEKLIQIVPMKDVKFLNEFGEVTTHYFTTYIFNGKDESESRSWFYNLEMQKCRKEFMKSKGYSGSSVSLIENTTISNMIGNNFRSNWIEGLIPEIYSSVEFILEKKSESDNLVKFYKLTY